MASFIHRVAPHAIKMFEWPEPVGDWKKTSASECQEASRIPQQYRKMVADFVVSMDAGEIAAVDAAAQTAADDAMMNEVRDYVYALKKQVRRELNTIRSNAGMANLTPAAFNSGIRDRLEEL